MKIIYYTIGELFRLQLLLNHKGDPYTTKAAVSRVVSRMAYDIRQTAYGPAKIISNLQVREWNNHWK